ncbi:MAG: hypothetical protein RIQ99_500, partial [Pseudomonadota bacterium]
AELRAAGALLRPQRGVLLGRQAVAPQLLTDRPRGALADPDCVRRSIEAPGRNVAELGLDPCLLTGEQEALTSALGVIGAFPQAKGVVADLGGGSLELVHVDADVREHGTSLPLGSLCLPQLRVGGTAKFGRRIHKIVKDSRWACPPDETLYLVGGSHRAFARFAMHHLNWPVDDTHGFELSPENARQICRMLGRGKVPQSITDVAASRWASLPDTAALLMVLLKEIRPARLVFSSWGLREGLLYEDISQETRDQDPLLAGVSEFVRRQGASTLNATMVAGWTASANPANGSDAERLRFAAVMLGLAAQGLEANLRLEHACAWALRKRWIGIDGHGRAMLATCIAANTGRSPALPAGLERLATPNQLKEAEIWGLAIRLCRRFTGASAQVLASSALLVEGAQLVLVVREAFGSLYTETVDKDLRLLAEKLSLQPSFRVVAEDAALN